MKILAMAMRLLFLPIDGVIFTADNIDSSIPHGHDLITFYTILFLFMGIHVDANVQRDVDDSANDKRVEN